MTSESLVATMMLKNDDDQYQQLPRGRRERGMTRESNTLLESNFGDDTMSMNEDDITEKVRFAFTGTRTLMWSLLFCCINLLLLFC
jgi:hypothetical protein